MLTYPPEICLPDSFTEVRGAIPTFHLNGHGDDCYGKYGFPCLPGVGRTCGEGVETEWAAINLVATSVREMTPAARQEVLNCHWGFWNWKKITEFGLYFSRKLKEAIYQRDRQHELFKQFTKTFSDDLIKEWSELVTTWDTAVLKWQNSFYQRQLQPKVKDPYREAEVAISMSTVRKELLKEETGHPDVEGLVMHEVPPSVMLLTGLDLEEQVRCIKKAVHDSQLLTPAAEAALHQKMAILRRRITSWRDIQALYMPFVPKLLSDSPMSGKEDQTGVLQNPKDFELLLPSSLEPEVFSKCPRLLVQDESRLRRGQADDALIELRCSLRVRHTLLSYKKLRVVGTGQGPNTRARALLNHYSDKIERHFQRYSAARGALEILDPDGDWVNYLQVLKPADLIFPSSQESSLPECEDRQKKRMKTSQGRREISWIWLSGSNFRNSREVETEMNESMRVEWVKSRARVRRWEEEVLLLAEEMRRVVAWLEWKSPHWEKRSCSPHVLSSENCGGLWAFACQQADMYSCMSSSYAHRWYPILESHGLPSSWIKKSIDTVENGNVTIRAPTI